MNNNEANPSSLSRKDFKQALSKFSRADLIKLVGDLYSTSPDNRNFLEAKFSSAAPHSPSASVPSLKRYKAIIHKNLFPDVMTGTAPLSFVPVRKAISDYKKATGDMKGVLELMVYAVECGNDFTLEYGDIDERFYDNLVSLFSKAVQLLKTMDAQTREITLPRLIAVVEKADGIGWGYHDGISDALYGAFPPE
jgi:hypothetical protein